MKKRIRELAVQYPRYGYRRIHILMKREGWPVNVKRIYRLYQLEGLQMRSKIPKRRVSARPRVNEVVASRVNECWSMDFVSDQLFTGQKLRALTVVDHFTRQSPAVEVRFQYKATDVVNTLEKAIQVSGTPDCIRIDNGPEFVSKELDLWAYARGVKLDFIRPGKPTDNAFIESFNSRFRQECLNQHWFLSLEDARSKVQAWWKDYNGFRPHSSLGNKTPNEFAQAQMH